ncbi:MAG: glycosyltransferase family 2 protein [Nitrospinota bacterium]
MEGQKITVAICVKNGSKTIAAAVRSICAQSVLPKKLIMVDDGSTDNTREEIKKAKTGDLPVEIIPNDGNGLFDGRNTALANCDTEYLAFIDADCEADEKWCEGILKIFSEHPGVAAGTGGHPQLGEANWVSVLHRMWFVVDSLQGAGYADGVVGANSYFRTSVLRELGGWISLPMGNAEDMYISVMINEAGYRMWNDSDVKVYHHYTRDFADFIKKTFNSGYAIVVMMQKAGWRNFWYYYTLCIPIVAAAALFGLTLGIAGVEEGWYTLATVLFGTFLFNLKMFKSVGRTLPRWAVRWIIIWGYSLGIIKAVLRNKQRRDGL